MNFAEQIKDFLSHQASRRIVELLAWVSDERLIQLTYLGEKLTADHEVLGAIRRIRTLLLDPTHPAKKMFRGVLEYLSPENRATIFHTLFNNGWFIGNKKRDQFEKEHGFRPPFVMILSPTWKCNLKCTGCYALGYQRHPGLPYDLVKRILRECMDMGLYFVTVLGGEPFLCPYLFQMMKDHPQIFFQIYTNGTALTKEKAERIRDLGNVMVVVSCEGYEEETDRWRGSGVFKKVMRAMDYLREARVLFGSSATVTKHNVSVVSSEGWIDMLLKKGIIAMMYFLYLPVNGQGDINLMVTPEQRDYIRKQVITESKPYFTHQGAEEIVTQMKDDIDAYAARYGVFADRIWREEYLKQPIVPRRAPSNVGFSISMETS